ncbi:hypothetical protein OBBRIDRAFT_714824, partial [Obba rivulosa]
SLTRYMQRYVTKTLHHISALSGAAWVVEVIYGHLEHIRTALGIHHVGERFQRHN